MPELTNESGTLMGEAYSASKKFLSSVLFVDDEIQMGESTGNGLSATIITDAFAAESIVPSFYSCKHDNQYEKILTLVRKTDVFVLDWKMPVMRADAEENPEADADSGGGRGFFARKLIEAIRGDETFGPLLIFIYTSEIDEVPKYLKTLPARKSQTEVNVGSTAVVTDSEKMLSQDAVDEQRPESGNNEMFEWVSADGNVRICVYFKNALKDNYGVDQSRVLTETQLASVVLKEYAKLHEGILPITLLRLLSTVRDNTRPLMAKFNAKLDQAFVIDRAMTPEPLDADRMLIDMMLNSVAALNNENDMPWGNEFNLVKKWLKWKEFNYGKLQLKLLRNEEINISDLIRWQEIGYKNFLREKMAGKGADESDAEQSMAIEEYDKNRGKGLLNDAMSEFSIKGLDSSEISIRCRDYAVLSQWKRLVDSCRAIPVLSLGTVLLKKDSEKYYLCVQPSCDTCRVESAGRDFLFLPLVSDTKRFNIILGGKDRGVSGLKVSTKAYDLVTFHFTPCVGSTDTVVKATMDENGTYIFTSTGDGDANIVYQWIGDLNETHALKIVHDYISNLGRVGIDESEWLRRS